MDVPKQRGSDDRGGVVAAAGTRGKTPAQVGCSVRLRGNGVGAPRPGGERRPAAAGCIERTGLRRVATRRLSGVVDGGAGGAGGSPGGWVARAGAGRLAARGAEGDRAVV